MSTWDSSNVQKWISSSPVFFHSPPTSFTNNVLCIDRSSYHPKITLELFFITIHILEVTPLGLSSTYHATIFRFYRASSQVTLRKKSQEWQQTQIDEPFYFVLPYYRAYSKAGNKYVRVAQVHASGYSQQRKNYTGACTEKCPSAHKAKIWQLSLRDLRDLLKLAVKSGWGIYIYII